LVTDTLFRGYEKIDLDDEGELDTNAITLPDFSCNWARFSKPIEVKKREGGKETDGCYSITVEVARYKNMATPCHDMIKGNYSHTEVRQLKTGESIFYEPPKNRKLSSHNWSKTKRFEYRQNIINRKIIIFSPT
jgi:hypothetical protein